jgi:hypothetical protein
MTPVGAETPYFAVNVAGENPPGVGIGEADLRVYSVTVAGRSSSASTIFRIPNGLRRSDVAATNALRFDEVGRGE